MLVENPSQPKEKTGNPFTLLAKAYDEGRREKCLEIMTGIYFYLCRQSPAKALRRAWRHELRDLSLRGADFLVKYTRDNHTSGYFIKLYRATTGGKSECYPTYDHQTSMDIDGRCDLVAKRARELMGEMEGTK